MSIGVGDTVAWCSVCRRPEAHDRRVRFKEGIGICDRCLRSIESRPAPLGADWASRVEAAKLRWREQQESKARSGRGRRR